MKSFFKKYTLHFKRPSGTSRGILTQKETYFLYITNEGKMGVGECGILKGLSVDDRPDYQEKLGWVCQNIALGKDFLLENLTEFPSIQFGVEQAFLSLNAEKWHDLFPSEFSKGNEKIPINGLIWMGTPDFMKEQIKTKLSEGFSCLKMKIGAIDFEQEYAILKEIRREFSVQDIEIRVDANGAFSFEEALEKLSQLADLQLHSIEQPIKAGQVAQMAFLCEKSPLPIALDEELIGVFSSENKRKLLHDIQPQFIILKPSLVGGYKNSEEWIQLAENQRIGWWITSALESNIGLNAIAQWTFSLKNPMPQGLGTGSLYTNNIASPLQVKNGFLSINPNEKWDFLSHGDSVFY